MATTPPPTQPPMQPPLPPPPPYQQPLYPPPAQSNNALMWILGIIGGGILLLVIGAFFVVLMVLHSVHVNQAGDRVDIETPVGAIRANKGGTHSTGLPVYPGATPIKSEGANVEVSSNWGGAGVAVEKYRTEDPRDTVQAWYSKHLGNKFRKETSDDNGHNSVDGLDTHIEKDEIAFVDDTEGKGAKVVSLEKSSGGTDITLVRAGKREED
jgi:hypothetical protein